jgi:hypothetical protein
MSLVNKGNGDPPGFGLRGRSAHSFCGIHDHVAIAAARHLASPQDTGIGTHPRRRTSPSQAVIANGRGFAPGGEKADSVAGQKGGLRTIRSEADVRRAQVVDSVVDFPPTVFRGRIPIWDIASESEFASAARLLPFRRPRKVNIPFAAVEADVSVHFQVKVA